MSKNVEKVLVPDISGATDVDIIEVFVKPGDSISVEDPLITLEGDKASMDVPSPIAGVVKDIAVKIGDKVSEGSLILSVETSEEKKTEEKPKQEAEKAPEKEEPKESEKETETEKKPEKEEPKEAKKETEKKTKKEPEELEESEAEIETGDIHAGPGVRRIAREFGVDLKKISGSGAKSRIVKEDVQQFVKQQLKVAESGGAAAGFSVLPAPKIDFKKFGEVETKPLSKIKKISGANLHRNWVTIPHVTQFDEADITELEAFRQEQKQIAAKQGIKLTPLVFIMKAVVAALKEFPIFNSSLDESGENLIMKKYFHIGVAVDTPNGLVVPVIRDVEKKGMFELAHELAEISKKAREKGLGLSDMQGGCFTISSLGGIGGTAFTPIINSPEVAILGVSRSSQKPVYQTYGEFVPRLMLPLSLSYDHRVIDGADGARFIVYLSKRLEDIRTLLL